LDLYHPPAKVVSAWVSILMGFSELYCLSNFSFLKAASHPEELMEAAHTQGYDAIAITDECSLAGVVRAWRKKTQLNTQTQLIVGSHFVLNGDIHVALAKNKTGYGELCQFITQCRRSAEKGHYRFDLNTYLKCLAHCVLLYQPNRDNQQHSLDAYQKAQRTPCLILEYQLGASDVFVKEKIERLSKEYKLDIVASNGARMHSNKRKPLLDTLTAIRLNKPVHRIAEHLTHNSESYLKPVKKLQRLYSSEYILNTQKIACLCEFELSQIQYQYPEDTIPNGHHPLHYLKQQSWQGAHRRYPNGIPRKVKALLKKEFSLIQELQYEYYFLTVYDIVQFAKRQSILHQGRGSAANSVVCYCLGITEVDPTKVNLLFERFINRRRNEPPDIDVDFDNRRREEVIQYLYKKYGRHRCAIAATVITYRPKSALRDVSKALNLDLVSLENIIANYGWRYRSKNWIDDIIQQPGWLESQQVPLFKQLLSEILGFPRHLSQHVGGFILSQCPLDELVPIENAAMEDRTVIQWDKDDLETMRLMKVDVLALGMMQALQKCLDDISTLHQRPFQLQDIPQEDDPKVYDMLCKADSVGLFQVESRAQMNMLPRLKPRQFYDLVVQVAIVRPGPIHGDMVHPYLKRKNGLEEVSVPLASMEAILKRTYGVPIFQEQVIAIAMIAADFSAEEAEDLRRSMASWKKQGHMNGFQEKLHTNLSKKGVPVGYIEQLRKQIEGFGEYGFPESHAASFALLAYYSAWMKYYYPCIFYSALLNSQPMGFYSPWQLIQDAQNHGVSIRPLDINQSHWEHRPFEKESAIQMGFRLIKGLKKETALQIIDNRPKQGYESIQHVMDSNTLNTQALDKLAASHCFRCFTDNRYRHQWEVQSQGFYTGLFENTVSEHLHEPDITRYDNLLLDYQSTGVLLTDHPMALLRDEGKVSDCMTAEQLKDLPRETEVYVAGIITNRQRPKTSAGVTFVSLEDETGTINLIVWLNTAQRQLKELSQARCLKVYGKVDKDEQSDVTHFIAYKLFDMSDELTSFESKSRDYH